MRMIDANALSAKMYHDAFETDSDMQKWDSGCWIRYKMFEKNLEDTPTIAEPERTAKVIEHDASIMDDRGYKYLRTEYLCENCKKKVIGGDEYCSHCGCRLEWK